MLRMKTSCFFNKGRSFSCILCKTVNPSQLNCQRLSLCPGISKNIHSKGKERPIDKLSTYTNETKITRGEENVSQKLLKVSFNNKQSNEDQLFAKNYSKKKDVSKLFKQSLSEITEILKEETLLTMEATQNDLKDRTNSTMPNKSVPKSLTTRVISPSAADGKKIKILKEILYKYRGDTMTKDLTNWCKIFYSLSSNSIKKNIDLEEAFKTHMQTYLLQDHVDYYSLCRVILDYGKAVGSGLTTLDKRFVDDIYNTISAFKQENLSLIPLGFLVQGVHKIRYMNHNLLIYLESYLKNNFKEVEQNYFLFCDYFKLLSDYDFPSRGDQWPFLKILLENAKPFTIEEMRINPNVSYLESLIWQSLLLISLGVFPKSRLYKIFELAQKEKSLVEFGGSRSVPLLLYKAVGDQFFQESGRPLFSEEIVQALVEYKLKFLRIPPLLKIYKTCLEKDVGVKDSVLLTANSKINTHYHLIMVFNDKNQPYCLEKFLKEKTTIEDLNFPINSKVVVVRSINEKDYFEHSDGSENLSGIDRLITRLWKNLGFYVVNLEWKAVKDLDDFLLGNHIYDQINKTIEGSSVDYLKNIDISKIKFKHSPSDITEIKKGETLLTMEATKNDRKDGTNSTMPNKSVPKSLTTRVISPPAADDVKIEILKEILYESRGVTVTKDFGSWFKIFYSLSSDSIKKNIDLEEAFKTHMQTYLLQDHVDYYSLCRVIKDYGIGVDSNLTTLDRRFVDNIYNTISASKEEDLSLTALYFLLRGVRKIRYMNHNLLIYLESYLKNNFKEVEQVCKDDLFYKYIKTLSDYNFPSRGDQWPFLKILLENARPDTIKEMRINPEESYLESLIRESLPLISMGLFPKALLYKIFELAQNEKSLVEFGSCHCVPLLLYEAVGDQFFQESGRPLFSEEIVQALVEYKHKFLRIRPSLERYKTCLEKAVGVKDSVLLTANSKIDIYYHLIMVFNDENRPYCLEKFSREKMAIEDLNFPINSKIVVVRSINKEDYYEHSDGSKNLSGVDRLITRLYENLGFHVVNIPGGLRYMQNDSLLGNRIYDEIRKIIERSSVD